MNTTRIVLKNGNKFDLPMPVEEFSPWLETFSNQFRQDPPSSLGPPRLIMISHADGKPIGGVHIHEIAAFYATPNLDFEYASAKPIEIDPLEATCHGPGTKAREECPIHGKNGPSRKEIVDILSDVTVALGANASWSRASLDIYNSAIALLKKLGR